MRSTIPTGRLIASVCVVACAVALAATYDARSGSGPASAEAVPVPSRIGADSSVSDIMRFAETSGGRWRTVRVRGRAGRNAPDASATFEVVAQRPDRSRIEQAGVVRVRDGATLLKVDSGSGAARRVVAPSPADSDQRESEQRMAAHRADDPTLSRPGERIVDTPVNDLISPAGLIRRELRLAAVSVANRGGATVAGRPAVVLEVRFPRELAKEDHWDLYVDTRTGILLGMVIEPLLGEERYEAWVDAIEVDPILDPETFDTTVAAGRMGVRP